MSDIITYEMRNGALPTTEADLALFEECMSVAVPFNSHWMDTNNEIKIMHWDAEWEKYIAHMAALIDSEGRDSYLPWNLYKTLGVNWVDGYAFQQRTGDCVSFSHRNSLNASALTMARRTGLVPKGIANSMTYSLARGNGRVAFGSGLNLNPMSKWAATVGNFWSDDFGPYDVGAYTRKYKPNSQQTKNALKTQSVVIYLPDTGFDYIYSACMAGFGVAVGSSVYPSSSTLNSDDLGEVSGWARGSHATAFVAARKGKKTGRRYVYFLNSHLQNYVADSLSGGLKQRGCWMSEADVKKMCTNFTFGTYYVNLSELGS